MGTGVCGKWPERAPLAFALLVWAYLAVREGLLREMLNTVAVSRAAVKPVFLAYQLVCARGSGRGTDSIGRF
jgi:hypothetical protein